MKSKLTKFTAAIMAMTMTMCGTTAFAADSTTQSTASGTISSSFGVYSPTIVVSVPLTADVQVNPMYDATATANTLKTFSVASKDIIIGNATVDTDSTDASKKVAIPVSVTAKATLSKVGDGVVTHYAKTNFTASDASTSKEIQLNLTQGTATAGATKKLDTSDDTAVYSGKTTPVTAWGSQIQFKVAGPTLDSGSTAADEYGLGAFAITGTANTNADWKAEDLNVAITYNVKASSYDGAPVGTVSDPQPTKGSDAVFILPKADLADSKVISVGLHNNEAGSYGDYVIPAEDWKVEICENAGTPANAAVGDAVITVSKDNVGMANLGENYAGKPQDFVIVTEDGRFIVTTLTVKKATS
jgi:aspartate 1-decarboxylase